MRHWRPFIGDTVERMVADGQRRAVAIVMAPHFSTMSIGAYEKKLDATVAGRLDVTLVERWGDHPAFLDAVATRLEETLLQFPDRSKVAVIFSAHSLPQRILAAGDAYPTELRASAGAVADRLGLGGWPPGARGRSRSAPSDSCAITWRFSTTSMSSTRPWRGSSTSGSSAPPP
jgi:ferrochelatase